VVRVNNVETKFGNGTFFVGFAAQDTISLKLLLSSKKPTLQITNYRDIQMSNMELTVHLKNVRPNPQGRLVYYHHNASFKADMKHVRPVNWPSTEGPVPANYDPYAVAPGVKDLIAKKVPVKVAELLNPPAVQKILFQSLNDAVAGLLAAKGYPAVDRIVGVSMRGNQMAVRYVPKDSSGKKKVMRKPN
jgi:hypothetical protein